MSQSAAAATAALIRAAQLADAVASAKTLKEAQKLTAEFYAEAEENASLTEAYADAYGF